MKAIQPIKVKTLAGYLDNLLWIGLAVGIFYWFAESAIHAFIFHEGTVPSQLLTRDTHEIWKRSFVFVLILLFSFYAQARANERKFKDNALKELERKYRTLFEEGLIPILLFDSRGCFLDCNRSALDFFECSRDLLLGRSIWEYSSDKTSNPKNEVPFSLSSQKNLEIDYCLNDKVKTLMINLVPYDDSGRKIIYGIGQDITTRKVMEQEIHSAHLELNQIFQSASVGMRVIDHDFTVLKINETFEALSGESVTRAVGQKCYDYFKGGACHTDRCPLNRIMSGEKEIEFEVAKKRKDGSTVHCLLTARPFYGPKGEMIGIVESFKNIGELKRIQENLRTEHDKLSRILFQRLEGVGIVNDDYSIEYLNEALENQFGQCRGEKCHMVFRESSTPCEDCIMHNAFMSGKLKRYEFNASNGRIYEQTYTPFLENDGSEKVLVAIRDVTDVKTAKAVAYRSEQLAALGELAAGVAHEINNPINGIINYAQILINKNGPDEEINTIAGSIRKESNRVARIVESLLSFSHRERQSKIPASLAEILNESLTLINSQMRKEAITIKKNIPSNLPQIFAIPQEIQQVFINILSNARYSLNKKFPKTSDNKIIRIEAKPVEYHDTRYVRISFTDHGTGIPKENLHKVIHPFFSTKPRGVGTGLGLSITHGIITEHGGRIHISSQEGEYTLVITDLPIATQIH